MMLQQVQSDEELRLALSRIEEIWEVATEGTKELAELNFLATLVSDYEDKLIFKERKDQPEIQCALNNYSVTHDLN